MTESKKFTREELAAMSREKLEGLVLAMHDNLTATQVTCTRQLEEIRRLRRVDPMENDE